VYVIDSVPALRIWLAIHPHRGDPNAFVWPSRNDPYEPVEPASVNRLLTRLCKRAKVAERKPHDYRHTRATRAARANWNESKMRHYFGWAEDSDMPAWYIHLANADLEAQVRADAKADAVGALIREDPTKALQAAVAAAVAAAVPAAVAETVRQLRTSGTRV
jgi:integrase